ncbi:MAG: DUF4156 domain-containing protein [Gammaproteobacteria bacterium]|nr:DUF4156 domain-containing protein [Gammaproteobacteria bacterium]MDH5777467.1 DUF4156 domain-containing protein [Gammaproteobacteria bacterium]
MNKLSIIVLSGFILSACTWVELTAEGEKVRVLSASEVKSCKKLGKAVVKVKHTIANVERNKEKMTKELEQLARNTAVELKGDTVVPATDIKEGKQTFHVYRCVNP